MRLLVSGASATMARLMPTPLGQRYLGRLLTPANWADGSQYGGQVWACDNGCFGGLDEPAFRSMCVKVARLPHKPLWVCCPDVVGDSEATANLWPGWMMWLHSLGLEPCYVLQDGQENRPELPESRAYFIGGSTEWKESRAVRLLASEVKERGAWLHMGRVNTRERFHWACSIGCDSLDGSGFSVWPDTNIPKALRWLDELETPLFAGVNA